MHYQLVGFLAHPTPTHFGPNLSPPSCQNGSYSKSGCEFVIPYQLYYDRNWVEPKRHHDGKVQMMLGEQEVRVVRSRFRFGAVRNRLRSFFSLVIAKSERFFFVTTWVLSSTSNNDDHWNGR